MKRIIIFLFVAFSGLLVLEAQNTCTEQLREAQQSFDDGLLSDIPQQLAACMKEGFTKEEKANGYKLLIQTYLFSEQIEEAEELMIRFLTEFPSYSIAINDPKEFINLYSSYRTDPIFKIEVAAGVSFCLPIIYQHFGPENIENSDASYTPGAGFSAEVNYIEALNTNFSISAGASFTYLTMGYYNTPYDYTEVTATLTNMYVGIPLALRYNYSFGRIDLFTKIGVEPVYLIESMANNLTRTRVTTEQPLVGNKNFTHAHKMLDVRPYLGIGVEINLGRDQLILTAGYKASTFLQLKEESYLSGLAPGNPTDTYLYTEDDLWQNQATVSLSYIRPIYKPKKIR